MAELVILGMHRSGTSLVAQACAKAGISPGPDEDLLSAQSDNPQGFFENKHLVALNDALLADAGGSWFQPPHDAPQLTGHEEAAEELMLRLREHSGEQFLLKDPRLCLTFDALAEKFSDPVVLFVYRSPIAVARSLARRNRFPLQLGLLLWEYYNRRALEFLPAAQPLAVAYEQVAQKPAILVSILQRLKQRGIACEPDLAATVFDTDLEHSAAASTEEAWLLLSDEQRRLHERCIEICRGDNPTGESVLADLPAEDPLLRTRIDYLASALEPLSRVIETGLERDQALALCEERTKERDQTLEQFSRLNRDHLDLVEAHEKEKLTHSRAEDAFRTLQKDHDSLATAHQREHESHQALIGDHGKLLDLHNELHQELVDARGEFQVKLDRADAVRSQLEEKHSTLKQTHSTLKQTHEELVREHEQVKTDFAAAKDKAEYLFFALTETYRTLLVYEYSFLANLQRRLRTAYRVLTGRRGWRTLYEDLLAGARAHFTDYSIPMPEKPPGKLKLLGDILRYLWKNPAASARSFSWQRLRRANKVFFGASRDDLSVWIESRFPDSDAAPEVTLIDTLSESLDTLELDFPEVSEPQVSIIVPVYNDYRVTVNCLQSLHRHAGSVSFEIIVADDCSTDLTATLAERFHGVRVSRTEENVRFLRNCNHAAKMARGEFLLLLNNDTAVSAGWLESLLEPFADDNVGVIGPKLLFPDGKLQEAGGIIWRDASGWNFGRGDAADKPAYTYRREVDYVSGACLVIRRSLWDQLGGFDDRFAPAYYEDADLCFSAREAGYRVVYQPRSEVYHYEGVSHGTDLSSGIKQHQVTNQRVFRDKWHSCLDAEHFPNAEHVIHARDRSAGKTCVLVIDHYVPHHDKDAGGRSTYLYIKLLLELGCRVQLMGANFFPHQPYTQALEDMGVEVLVGESIARHLDEWLAQNAPYIDEIFLHRPHVAEQFLPNLERMHPRPQISFIGHDLHYLRIQREAALKDDEGLRRDAAQWRQRELAVCSRVDRVYYFSQAELDELASQVPAEKLRRIPLYAIPLAPLPAYAPVEAQSLLFVGGFNHPPNVDAVGWLANDILPLIARRCPDVHLHLVGSNATSEVRALASDAVTVHGYLSDEDLSALYRRVAAAIVPLRFGAGVKGKVIEAVQHNVPLVTTDIGAEGLPDADAVFFVANTAEEIADKVVTLFEEGGLGEEKMMNYPSWLAQHFSLDTAAEALRRDMPALARALSSPAA